MIKTKKLTPQVYYDTSRDFQALGRTFDVVFNYIKTNTNLILGCPLSKNSDEQLLDLISLTLGFKSKHNYNSKQLYAICSCFSSVLRNKSNLQGIEDSVNALLQAEGISELSKVIPPSSSTEPLEIYLPEELTDINLLLDLFDYILPAGLSCRVIRKGLVVKSTSTKLTEQNKVDSRTKEVWDTSFIPKHSDVMESTPDMEISGLGGGRVDNSVIPPYKKEEETE